MTLASLLTRPLFGYSCVDGFRTALSRYALRSLLVNICPADPPPLMPGTWNNSSSHSHLPEQPEKGDSKEHLVDLTQREIRDEPCQPGESV